ENKVEFTDKVKTISTELGINHNWLMFVMWFESKLNPQAVNPISGATGLIQFMPSTARSLGTTTDVLRRMSNVQ
ncbi:transglycosylase SLT domain-containing protein, partial [Salmonella enterica]|uniref:transglycosylase SLT domain-containing protein n=1 Tax=Salmonella enterica TaxID=28901 RepID=UPI003CECE9E7